MVTRNRQMGLCRVGKVFMPRYEECSTVQSAVWYIHTITTVTSSDTLYHVKWIFLDQNIT